MALTIIEAELILIQKLKKQQIHLLRNGVRIEAVSGQTIDSLVTEACRQRLKLSSRFLRSAGLLNTRKPVLHRDIVSRAYYAMYHAARAVSFFVQPGDDFEAHDKVASGLPADFPDLARWQNKLKNARLRRNEADYEPFMSTDPLFRSASKSILKTANEFYDACTAFLKTRGL